MDHMPRVAEMLGFPDERRLVTKVLEAQWRINNFTQIFVKKMVRRYLGHSFSLQTLRQSRIAPKIYAIDDRLFASSNMGNEKIETLLELLCSLEDKVWKFDPSFLAVLTYSRIRHPHKKSTHLLIRKLFERNNLFCFLELFYNAGVLHQLIGAFRKVNHLPQFDGYHHFPVDLHSIKCVAALENIQEPFIRSLYEQFTPRQQTIVKIVTLLHDTGKGRLKDHSEVGAKLVIPFMRHMNFTENEQALSSLLIRYHILMSGVAFKENIYHEESLYKFMSSIQSAENLKMLYVLTYADINGVGPGIYTSFNGRLLRELFDGALEVSQNAGRITDATKRLRIEKRISNNERFLRLSRIQQKKILSVESNLFFFKRSIDEILDICETAQHVNGYRFNLKVDKTFSIEIWRKIPLNLGYLLGNLSYLDVVGMDIITLFDGVKYFKIEFALIPSDDTLDQIGIIVEESFDMSLNINLKRPVIKKSEISFDCEHSKTYAQLIVNTANQKGLLAYIMQCFEEVKANVATAKIYSTKTKANDHFLIEKQNGVCDNAEKVIDLLIKGVN